MCCGMGGHPLHFDSEHPGVVQFCFVDDSVHAIAQEIDLDVFMALGGIGDGDLIADSTIGVR